jgi:hypothetical protein
MSFSNLMEEAWNIRHTAVAKAVQRNETHPDYARNGVENYYDFVPSLFKPYSEMPDPARYQPMIEDLRMVLQRLSSGQQSQDPINTRENYYANPNLARITTASSYLTEWSGPAAGAFKRNFLDPFPFIARNQFTLAAVCKSALEAHQAMWKNARDNADKIVHATLDSLEKRDRCDKNEWTITFTVVAAVALVASVPLSAVAIVGATAVAAVGSAATVAAVVPPAEEEVTYSGETVHQIVGQMKAAVDKLGEQIRTAEETIFKALDSTNSTVNSHKGLFVSPRPALADATPGNIRGLLGAPE